MATRRTITVLAPAIAAQVPDVVRRVQSRGVDTAVTPGTGDAAGYGWLKVTASVDDGTNVQRMNYTVSVYPSLGHPTPSREDAKARNSYEHENTSSTRAGYEVSPDSTTCGDITGIEPCPNGLWFPIVGRKKFGDEWFYLFVHRNDPTIYLT